MPTPIPVTVGQSVPVTGIGLGVPTEGVFVGVAETDAVAVGVGVAAPQVQSVLEVHNGLLQKPPEQIKPDWQLLSEPQVPLQVLGAAVGVGLAVAVAVGVGTWQAVISVVQAAPAAGQQY
ncbi:MAG TPA: hypothetical protein VKC54_00360 [Patescibacteria group bacterium]|nr:hypothetical protein [Patescibacteria group bacterium]